MENRNNAQTDSHIDISEEAEIQQWAEKLNVPEDILKDAVRAAGTTVVEVAQNINEDPSKQSASETVRLKEGPWQND